jgi:hypothetical protein
VQVAGADVAGQSLIRQAEPQILQLVVEGAGPQVRVLSPPQTGVLASKRASDRTGLCARMSTNVIAGLAVSTGAASGRRCRVLRTLADIGEPAGEPSLAETTPTSSLDTDRL